MRKSLIILLMTEVTRMWISSYQKDQIREVLECEQWLNSIINDKEPLVKPEQAFMVTKILDNIYKSAAEGHEIKF